MPRSRTHPGIDKSKRDEGPSRARTSPSTGKGNVCPAFASTLVKPGWAAQVRWRAGESRDARRAVSIPGCNRASQFGPAWFWVARALAPKIPSRRHRHALIHRRRRRGRDQANPRAITKTAPLKAASKTEDIAHAAPFLISDSSCHITGETLKTDAGPAPGLRSPSER
jgi:hypothetical protein